MSVVGQPVWQPEVHTNTLSLSFCSSKVTPRAFSFFFCFLHSMALGQPHSCN
jgi:hypothetical protein